MTQCPVGVGEYRVVDYQLDGSILPPLMPRATFRMVMSVFRSLKTSNVNIFELTIDGLMDNAQGWKKYQRKLKKH